MGYVVMNNLPQYIYLGLVFIGIGYSTAKYGQSKGSYDWADIMGTPIIGVGLLYWGGFFDGVLK